MVYNIVDVKKEHISEIELIEKECFSMPWTEEQLEGQLTDDSHIFIAAVNDNCVLGYVGLMYVLDEGYISNVAVKSRYRQNGVAEALISELKNRAEQLKLSFLTLEVRKSNIPARKLYEKCGFRDVGERKNYYERPKEDAVIMTIFF